MPGVPGSRQCLPWIAAVLLTIVSAAAWGAPVVGQVDSFNGSTDNWTYGQGVPQVISTGGPAGTNDSYLNISSQGGFGANSKLVVFNGSQWTGNYSAAGINAIQMELLDLGSSPLTIRIALKTTRGISPGWSSTTGFVLPADAAWHLATFPLDSTSLTPVSSPPPLASLLTNVGELRILSSAAPAVNGDTMIASVGIDEITALGTAVPEPAGALLLIAGLGLTLARPSMK